MAELEREMAAEKAAAAAMDGGEDGDGNVGGGDTNRKGDDDDITFQNLQADVANMTTASAAANNPSQLDVDLSMRE